MNAKLRSITIRMGIIGMILCFLPVIALANEAVPKAVAEIDSFDFGTVLEGKDVIYDFIIKNTGDALLKIENVRTG